MNNQFNKGLILASFGSFWWGFFGVLYFKYISFIGPLELVIHRCLWTVLTLVITTFYFSKWDIFFRTINSKKNLFGLFISGFLIFINWGVWIYAVATNRIIDASFGYFIMPILSVFLGFIFLTISKEIVFSPPPNKRYLIILYFCRDDNERGRTACVYDPGSTSEQAWQTDHHLPPVR